MRYLQFELPLDQSFTDRDRGGNDALDSDTDAWTGETTTFTVGAKEVLNTWDAGMGNGLGDRVWMDVDGDGFQDGGEPGVAGVGVELFTENGTPAGSTMTNMLGNYRFVDLQPGNCYLEFAAPAFQEFTLQDAVGDDDRDSDVDALTGRTGIFAFESGDLDRSWDAGVITSVTVGDRVWIDDDGNGIQDGAESGSSGVTVQLVNSSGFAIQTATDSSGQYGFVASPGTYHLVFVLPAGFAFAPRDRGGNDGADSDANPTTGTTILFALGAGGPDLSWDAGLEPAVLGNQVWLDGKRAGRRRRPGASPRRRRRGAAEHDHRRRRSLRLRRSRHRHVRDRVRAAAGPGFHGRPPGHGSAARLRCRRCHRPHRHRRLHGGERRALSRCGPDRAADLQRRLRERGHDEVDDYGSVAAVGKTS